MMAGQQRSAQEEGEGEERVLDLDEVAVGRETMEHLLSISKERDCIKNGFDTPIRGRIQCSSRCWEEVPVGEDRS